MRNPFTVNAPANTSHREVTERGLDPIEPIIETYEGDNLPYRGIEQHGVPMTAEPRAVPGYDEGVPVVQYEPEEPPQDPVPVRIVSSGGRELRRCRVIRSFAPPAGANSIRVVGRDEARVSVSVKNYNADRIWIGDSAETAHPMNGFPLDEGEEFTSSTQDELWVVGTHATDHTAFAVKVEYAVSTP